MSTNLNAHELPESHCPLSGGEICMDFCQPCRFFRGASNGTGQKHWAVVCNWPRDGVYISPLPDIRPVRAPIPDAFLEAFAPTESS